MQAPDYEHRAWLNVWVHACNSSLQESGGQLESYRKFHDRSGFESIFKTKQKAMRSGAIAQWLRVIFFPQS